MAHHASEQFLTRDTWQVFRDRSRGQSRGELRKIPKSPKGARKRRDLGQAYFETPHRVQTNQRFICYNCHYEDFLDDNTVYYYLVFGDFEHDEPCGCECPNCGGPLAAEG